MARGVQTPTHPRHQHDISNTFYKSQRAPQTDQTTPLHIVRNFGLNKGLACHRIEFLISLRAVGPTEKG